MGRVSAGVMSRWSPDYVRVWLKTGLVDSGGRWLYGTLFWPAWLRVAGMKVGRGCEISGLIDTVPEMVEIGAGTFCADGIYLAGPRVHRGTVAIAAVKLGQNTFLGNGVVIAGGQQLSDNILIGVCTIADETSIQEYIQQLKSLSQTNPSITNLHHLENSHGEKRWILWS